ncbi:hypothetical protein PR202_ga24789 [Eleusine coracana subsp. coracana]|uniref:Leucine-rich repeat-containing N-terminal plant-type domain-containing protein n=1 Tax=Eleusine coracana subsp. coracana TaxID=191504 RepID=A0AAV5D7N5_ELECO|nr:hypothetical protein PR202_ga24789 [Eleusine coracana subsp. coracana]
MVVLVGDLGVLEPDAAGDRSGGPTARARGEAERHRRAYHLPSAAPTRTAFLAANWSTGDACGGRWTGVTCSADGRRVVALSLPSLDLRGPLDPLGHLAELRTLDLRGNRLNGTLDALLRGAPNLALLYLSRNEVSGEIPADAVARLARLARVDLADNSLPRARPAGRRAREA